MAQLKGYRGGDMPKREAQAVLEMMKGGGVMEVAGKLEKDHAAISRAIAQSGPREVWNAREIKRQHELGEILEELQAMVKQSPETAFRYADKIAAMKLKAELDGHLSTHTEEKHLHIHGELTGLSEAQLRKELLKIEAEKSSNPASGTPDAQ